MLMPPVLIEIPFVSFRPHLSSWKSLLSLADATCPPGDPFCLLPTPPVLLEIPFASHRRHLSPRQYLLPPAFSQRMPLGNHLKTSEATTPKELN
ncbi:hypothetical protein AMTR_s00096p00032920 [Amborella trichopoda]|uniref:Uncharacterized protein n=1 Tax=Amborella trichopoda TaxID=13333 RepID=W1P354_AMBTC|nr:hypothetical protein AMTR_s00096p00032920 [Amborella trichopoda]